jgi:hypothetical protein
MEAMLGVSLSALDNRSAVGRPVQKGEKGVLFVLD